MTKRALVWKIATALTWPVWVVAVWQYTPHGWLAVIAWLVLCSVVPATGVMAISDVVSEKCK